jgi:hypothetical protein
MKPKTTPLRDQLDALSRSDPAAARRVREAGPDQGLRIEPARRGGWTMIQNGVTVHSRVDPQAEAARWADRVAAEAAGRPIVVFGFGLGYHLAALTAAGQRVWVVEPEPAVVAAALNHVDLAGVLENAVWIEPGRADPPPGAYLAVWAPTARSHPEALAEWRNRLARLPEATAGDWRSEVGHIPGAAALVDGLEPDAPVSRDRLLENARRSDGRPTPAEIYLLLINELDPTPARPARTWRNDDRQNQ